MDTVEGRRERMRQAMMEAKSDKGRRGECIGEREKSRVRRCKVKEIDGVAVSEGKG